LERLRFAQSSGLLDIAGPNSSVNTTPNGSNNNNNNNNNNTTKALKDKHFQDTRTDTIADVPIFGNTQNWDQPNHSSHECPAAIGNTSLRQKPKQIQLSREKQVALARQLRQSVLLDAADEALLRVGRRTSRRLSHNVLPKAEEGHNLYDSFRWLDEDDDLDLRLYVGDYHGSLKETTAPAPVKEENRMSFRRHLSLTRNPFGRSSVSSSRPATKDTGSMSMTPAPAPVPVSQKKRKSRALSLVTTKHATQDSITSIDPAAAHYQDPEARLKLRVYLASPQKFDEAIEFGFPSQQNTPNPLSPGQPRHHGRGRSDDSERFQTFLADDKSSTYSLDLSLVDPDSPMTPHTPEKQARKRQQLDHGVAVQDHIGGGNYMHSSTASREMTMRMTLTRPDLRANEDELYGWQQRPRQQHTTRTTDLYGQRDSNHQNSPLYTGASTHKQSFDQFFATLDEEATSRARGERGVAKRFWNRVRRN
jgi:hypothetical protein